MSCEGKDLNQMYKSTLERYYQEHRGLVDTTPLGRVDRVGRVLSFSSQGPESLKRSDEILAVLAAVFGNLAARALINKTALDIAGVINKE